MSEHDQQKMVCQWMDAQATEIKYFAVPNGARMSVQQIAKLKAEGMQTGVLDLIIVTPPPALFCHGVTGAVLEMKEPGRTLRPDQVEWFDWFDQAAHWIVAVKYDSGEAIAWLQDLGYGR